ncbi:MAG: F0F1 ATP synthase subunit alpha [Planctomycetes bacterium]|nr:F0F1 ATP synthase subunit alpha [Planctomycetota bacterium]
MKFDASEIASVLRQEISTFRSKPDVGQVGTVLEVGDGIARVHGLGHAMAGEMLEFASGARGQVFNLEANSIGAAVFGGYETIREGDEVRATGKLLEVPVGDAMLGRVIDALGQPVDGVGPIVTDTFRPIEYTPPGIADRQPVNVPLQTGIKAIDAMTAIGRGQRELIIGDRKTGKTAIAIDTILSQKGTGVICVYVAIGQKESTVAGVVDTLRRRGAMDYTIVVEATSADPASLQYIAPYTGCTIAEHFMYSRGADTLVVYDDLSKQAVAYRQLSLLLRRPPGREAYPGDVFYLHSRLLERSVKLAERFILVPQSTGGDCDDPKKAVNGKVYVREAGLAQAREDMEVFPAAEPLKIHRLPSSGGSMTALPIVETLEGEVAAYIPTNVISITDGQIYLVPSLFFSGVRPAIDVGISVSRVGGKAQMKAMKKVAGSLRLDLAAYRELEAFAQLGTELDPAAQRQLERGERLVELLKQPQFQPMDVVDQVVSLMAGVRGILDAIPVSQVRRFDGELRAFLHEKHADLLGTIAATGDLDDQTDRQLSAAMKRFADLYVASQARAAAEAAEQEPRPQSEYERAARQLGLNAKPEAQES